jgi:hypothetical protein
MKIDVSQLEKMKIELGDGTIVEMYTTEQGTLVTERKIQPIIPLVPVAAQPDLSSLRPAFR